MIETKKYCYCDILSEHDGQRVQGASTYKDVSVLVYNNKTHASELKSMTVDMCPACYRKYAVNLQVTYDWQGDPHFNFISNQSE